jgi:hypothetical protein
MFKQLLALIGLGKKQSEVICTDHSEEIQQPLTVAVEVRPLNQNEVNQLLAHEELQLALLYRGAGGSTVACPHCFRPYGIVTDTDAQNCNAQHVQVECLCGKSHISTRLLGGYT